MSRRSPQTQEKRRRERDKQAKQQAKLLARRARKAQKRAAKSEAHDDRDSGAPPLAPENGTAPAPEENET